MNTQWLTPKAALRSTADRGDAAFVVTPIQRGETVALFGGFAVTLAELAKLPAERSKRSIQVDADLYLVSGETREPGDMINHSCAPNCGMRGDIVVVAMRDIAPGEELTYDYAMSDASDYDEFVCRCGAPTCRRVIRGSDWRDPALQDRYRNYFTAYLRTRLERR